MWNVGGGGNCVFYYNKISNQFPFSSSNYNHSFFLTERSMVNVTVPFWTWSIDHAPRRVVSSSTITTTTRHNNTRGVHVGRTQQYTLHEVEYESLLLMAKSTYTWHKIVILFRRLWLSRV